MPVVPLNPTSLEPYWGGPAKRKQTPATPSRTRTLIRTPARAVATVRRVILARG